MFLFQISVSFSKKKSFSKLGAEELQDKIKVTRFYKVQSSKITVCTVSIFRGQALASIYIWPLIASLEKASTKNASAHAHHTMVKFFQSSLVTKEILEVCCDYFPKHYQSSYILRGHKIKKQFPMGFPKIYNFSYIKTRCKSIDVKVQMPKQMLKYRIFLHVSKS